MRNAAILLTLSLSVLVQSSFGQADKARIVGTVADVSGAVIPGASVTAKDNKTGAARQVTADEKGYYVLINLNPSDYTVTASGNGLGPQEYSEIHLSVG